MSPRPLPKWHSTLPVASISVRRDFIPFCIRTNPAIIWKHFRQHRMYQVQTIATNDPLACLSVSHAGGYFGAFARWGHTMQPFLNYFRHFCRINMFCVNPVYKEHINSAKVFTSFYQFLFCYSLLHKAHLPNFCYCN